jgi:hypothetical protein
MTLQQKSDLGLVKYDTSNQLQTQHKCVKSEVLVAVSMKKSQQAVQHIITGTYFFWKDMITEQC